MSTSESLESLAGTRILLADDHDDFRQLVRAFLSPQGVAVETASDGIEALRAATADPHDLILIDIQMPEMDGYQVTQRLRAVGFTAPIIAITAHAMTDHMEHALAVGCNEVLAKPVSLPTLREAICRCLHRAAARAPGRPPLSPRETL